MVLMRMGEDERDQIVAPADDELRVGHDDVDARRGVVAEGDAQIEHQPFAGMTQQVEVHADLSRPAERHEDQILASGLQRVALSGHGSRRGLSARSSP